MELSRWHDDAIATARIYYEASAADAAADDPGWPDVGPDDASTTPRNAGISAADADAAAASRNVGTPAAHADAEAAPRNVGISAYAAVHATADAAATAATAAAAAAAAAADATVSPSAFCSFCSRGEEPRHRRGIAAPEENKDQACRATESETNRAKGSEEARDAE